MIRMTFLKMSMIMMMKMSLITMTMMNIGKIMKMISMTMMNNGMKNLKFGKMNIGKMKIRESILIKKSKLFIRYQILQLFLK